MKLICGIGFVVLWFTFMKLSNDFAMRYIGNVFVGSVFIIVVSICYSGFLIKLFDFAMNTKQAEKQRCFLISNHGDIELG